MSRDHSENLLFPICFRIAREVEFTHHWKPGLAVKREVLIMDSDPMASRREPGSLSKIRAPGSGHGLMSIDLD